MGESEEDILVIRIPRVFILLGVVVCLILMIVPAISIYFAGVFRWAETGFMFLIFLFLCLFLFIGSLTTTFSSKGISCKSLGVNWEYPWERIELWGRELSPSEAESIYFMVKGSDKKHYIQGLQEDRLAEVRQYLLKKCGEAKVGQENEL